MNAIRPDEKPDRTHSVFVDQWDWEKVIDVKDRNTDYLKKTVKSIVAALDQTAKQVAKAFPTVDISVTKDVYFVTSQELEDMYPSLTPAQREQEITRQHKTWNDVLGEAMELSSMGIRVDADSLVYQLIAKGCDEKLKLPYHSDLVSGKLPYTIGGGIGQSRLCMFLLKKRHIGEVQVSVWPDDQLELCAEENITLL